MRLPEDPVRRRVTLVAIAALVIGLYFLVTHLLSGVDVEELLRDVSRALGDFTYLLVGLFAFLETGAFVGLVVPGETVVILGGAVAGQGETSVWLTVAIVWACAFAGDSASFMLGHRLGRGFVLEHGHRLRITRERFARVEEYFASHGGKTILIGRFIGLVRALAPFIAGSSGMPYRQMAPFSILGTGLWATTFTLLGYFASQSINEVVEASDRGLFWFALVVGTIVAIVVAVRYLRVAVNRARLVSRLERRSVLRPLVAAGRRLRPQARFLWDRLTPGGIGLEFTTLSAALAVALFIVVAYAVTLAADPGPTPGDQTAFDVAADLRAAWLTDVAEALTELGRAAIALPIAALAAIVLGLRRRWPELIVLVVAMAIVVVANSELKEVVERPRPPDPLVEVSGYSYPSGHAAYSVLYVWLALTVAIRVRPRIAGAAALVAAGIAIAAAVGLTRVYLRVHYLSDVSGGWALGVAAFSACGALALLVLRLRENAASDAPPRRDPT